MSSSSSPFQGIWIPLVTPFAHGELDLAALRQLVRHYIAAGVHGLVACGSTGEAAALDAGEQLAVLDTVLEEAGSVPVVMGLAGNHGAQALSRLAAFSERPLAGILAPAPYYIRPGQSGARDWFERLADASAHPLIVYDIPYRTSATLEAGTLLTLASHPNIAALKDCGGCWDKSLTLIADGRLRVMAGEDLQGFGLMCQGATGMIAAAAHIRPDLYVAMYHALQDGRLAEARELSLALAPLIRLLFAEPNPAPAKALLARAGWLREELRTPMPRASDELRQRLEAAAESLDARYPPAH